MKTAAEKRIYARDYYQRNKAHIKILQKKWLAKPVNLKRDRARQKRYRQLNPFDWREYYLRRGRHTWIFKRYGLTKEQYDAMSQEQNGVCAICQRPEKTKRRVGLSVDHCHSSGRVRGLLCVQCNFAIGAFDEDPTILQRAIVYLMQNPKPYHTKDSLHQRATVL